MPWLKLKATQDAIEALRWAMLYRMVQTINEDTVLRRADSILETQVDGEVVLMSLEAGHCYGLDAIGSEIWLALQMPATQMHLQHLCRDRYAGDPATIDADVAALLAQLLSEGLIETAN